MPVALTLSCAMLAPAAAHAATEWLPPQTLSSAAQFSPALRTALPADGSALVVWTRGPFDANSDQTPTALESSVRLASADSAPAWPGPAIVAGADISGLDVATAPTGDVYAVFAQSGVVRVAHRPVGATGFRDLGPMSDGPVGISPVPRIGVNADGDIVAAWHDMQTQRIAARVRRADGTLSAVQELTGGGTASRTAATIDEQGRATVAWSETGSPHTRVLAATAGPSGTFAAAVPVAASLDAQQTLPQVVHAADGTISVAFASRGELFVASRASDAEGFADAERVTGETRLNTYDSPSHQLLVDARGTLNALWHTGTHDTPGGVFVARRTPSGSGFDAPIAVLPTGSQIVRASSGAVDATGRTLLAWWQRPVGGGTTSIAAAWVEPDGTVGDPRPIAQADDLPGCGGGCAALRSTHTAVSPDGDGLVAWSRNLHTGGWVTEGAGYDASGPLLDVNLDTSTVSAGQPITATAEARDRWSGVSRVDWEVNGSTIGSGPVLRHAFDVPGEHRIRVTARDGRGLTTTAERTVTVSSNPAAPDPPAPVVDVPDAPSPTPSASTDRPAATARPRITTMANAQRIDGRRRVRLATVVCPPARGACIVRVPKRISIRVGTLRTTATVLAPHRIAAGKRATLRLRVPARIARTTPRPRITVKARLAVRHDARTTTKTIRVHIAGRR